jgi:hypothetical protein
MSRSLVSCALRWQVTGRPGGKGQGPVVPRGYGHLDEVGRWGATDPATGSSTDEELPAPHLLWPADHRWFAATDVDSGFTWAGGSQGLIDAVITDPELDAGRVHRS